MAYIKRKDYLNQIGKAKQDTESSNTAILEFLASPHTEEEYRKFLNKLHTHLTLMLISDFKDLSQ